MSEYDISIDDVRSAAKFLQNFLTATYPTLDFSQDGPIYRSLIEPQAAIAAYLLKQGKTQRDLESLLRLKNLPDEEAVKDGADSILSNWFLDRAVGSFARGVGKIYFSMLVDALIPVRTRFYKTATHTFFLDSSTDLLIPASSLRPYVGPNGDLAGYTATVPLIAARTGEEYNLPKGAFVGFDAFNYYATKVENETDFSRGTSQQSTTDYINESKNAISLRTPINQRSNRSSLMIQFPDIQEVLSIGHGQSEMVRDLLSETHYGIMIHVGGCSDIFVRLPIQEYNEQVGVESLTNRADGRVLSFLDSAPPLPLGGVFTDCVVPGDVLAVASGLPEAPFHFLLNEVKDYELVIQTRVPFSTATDEESTHPLVSYSVGNNYPLFDNKLKTPPSGTGTATTSRKIAVKNRVTLQGRPIYRIKLIEFSIYPASMAPYVDTTTGTLRFTKQVNDLVLTPPTTGQELKFRVVVWNPSEMQSSRNVVQVEIGWPAVDLKGYTAEVTYDTLMGFDSDAEYVESDDNRIQAADALVRGQHPVYPSFTVPYRLHSTVTQEYDEETVALNLAEYINNWTKTDPIDANTISAQARLYLGEDVSVFPFTVDYELLSPDGKLLRYRTNAQITVTPTVSTDPAIQVELLNPTEIGLPSTGYHTALQTYLLRLGVSDRTTRIITNADDIAFLKK